LTKEKPISRKIVNRGFSPARRGPGRPSEVELDDLAAAALAFLAEQPESLAGFFAATGLTPASLRSAVGSPGFARGILSYIASDEALLVLFAESHGSDPAALGWTLQALTGSAGEG
jgi:hypothetical protein